MGPGRLATGRGVARTAPGIVDGVPPDLKKVLGGSSGSEALNEVRDVLWQLELWEVAVPLDTLNLKPWLGPGPLSLGLNAGRIRGLCIDVESGKGRMEGRQRGDGRPIPGEGGSYLPPGPHPVFLPATAHASDPLIYIRV